MLQRDGDSNGKISVTAEESLIQFRGLFQTGGSVQSYREEILKYSRNQASNFETFIKNFVKKKNCKKNKASALLVIFTK